MQTTYKESAARHKGQSILYTKTNIFSNKRKRQTKNRRSRKYAVACSVKAGVNKTTGHPSVAKKVLLPTHARQKPKRMAIEQVVDVLIAEYQNVHERVFRQISQYEENNVKTLMLVGVLLFFGITNYDTGNSYISLFVDGVFFGALPVIAICSALLGVADLVKVMILGDYLKIIENKINDSLSDEVDFFNFPRNRILDWEYWRLNFGYAKNTSAIAEISFSFIVVVLIVLVSVFTAIVRLLYIHSTFGSSYRYKLCFFSSLVFSVLFVLTLGISVIVLTKRRKITKANVNNDKAMYSGLNRANKIEKV